MVVTDLPADQRDRHGAGAHRLAVDMHRAGAAGGDAAAEFGAGQFEVLAQHPEQRRIGPDFHLLLFSVEGKCNHVRSPHFQRASSSPSAGDAQSIEHYRVKRPLMTG